jgi:hypothetical protein
MALGARRYHIQAVILGEGAALVAAGSLTLARRFGAFSDVLARTFGERSSGSLLLLFAPLLLSAIALLACSIPAPSGHLYGSSHGPSGTVKEQSLTAFAMRRSRSLPAQVLLKIPRSRLRGNCS